jgi:hypothetical protein
MRIKKERKKRKIIKKNSGHFVPLQRQRAAHILRSDQNMTNSLHLLYDGQYSIELILLILH